MRAVNLLPGKPGRASGLSGGSKRPLIIGVAALLIAGVGYMTYSAKSEVSSLSEQVAVAEADKAALEGELNQLTALEQSASAQELRRGSVVTLATGRINWERVMRDTVTIMPDGTWLTQMTGTAPVAAAAAGAPAAGQPQVAAVPQGLHLEGFAFTQPQVAQLLARMEAISGLGTPRLASAEKITRGGKNVVQFVIDAPVDQRSQDRPTLQVTPAGTPATAPAATPAAGGQGGGF